jgi:hypothetical protein
VEVGHVVRREQDGVVAGRIEVAVGAVDDLRFGKGDAALGLEVVDGVDVLSDGRHGGCGRRLRMRGRKRNSDEDMTQYESDGVLHGAGNLLQVECRVDGSDGKSTGGWRWRVAFMQQLYRYAELLGQSGTTLMPE